MISEENIEKTHDKMERLTLIEIIGAAASRGKGKQGKMFKVSELYERPSPDDKPSLQNRSEKDIIEEIEYTNEWLSQFDFSDIANKYDGEEENNGIR